METIYVLTYEESEILGYRIFSDYKEALKEYIKHCITETKALLSSDTSSDSSEEEGPMNCTLEVQELNGKEYEMVKEFDYEHFKIILDSKEDIVNYMTELEGMVDSGSFPEDVLELYSE